MLSLKTLWSSWYNLFIVIFHFFPGGHTILDMPRCSQCSEGDLVPLSDFGSQGAPIHYKAWVCTNMQCGFNIKIRNGDVHVNEPINDGASYTARVR